jgi:hypothetical protein
LASLVILKFSTPVRRPCLYCNKLMFLLPLTIYSVPLYADNWKEFIATIVVDLLKSSNPNCFVVTGRPRTPRDQGSVESANKLVQGVLKSISLEMHLQSPQVKVNWTALLGQDMAVCNSHSGMRKNSVSSYEAVFGQKYHPQIKVNMSQMHECKSIFQRLKLSPDQRLQTYVNEHDIVDIPLDSTTEFLEDEDSLQHDTDKEEGADLGDDAFPELAENEDDADGGGDADDGGLHGLEDRSYGLDDSGILEGGGNYDNEGHHGLYDSDDGLVDTGFVDGGCVCVCVCVCVFSGGRGWQ